MIDYEERKKSTKNYQKLLEQTEQAVTKEIKKQEEERTKSAKKRFDSEIGLNAKLLVSAGKAAAGIGKAVKGAASAANAAGKGIKASFSETFSNLKENAKGKMEDVIASIRAPGKSAKSAANDIETQIPGALAQAGQKAEETETKLQKVMKGAKALGGGMLEAGKMAADVGKQAVAGAVEMERAMDSFAAQTGKGSAETEKYQGVLEKIYSNNYGESFEDIASAMADVTNQMGDMDDGSLQSVTESAVLLRDTFGIDVAESTKSAQALMDGFGVSGEEAMNIIAAGAQNGMWSVEQIGSAASEMSSRILSGSEEAKEGFEGIGLNAEEMTEKFAAGGESAKEAFQQTLEALAEMEDPLEQNAAGAALFGESWEEMGPGVIEQLAGITDGTGALSDAMEGMKEAKSEDLGTMFEGLKRSIETMLIPLGEELMPILGEVIGTLGTMAQEALPPLIEAIGGAISQMAPVVSEILPMLSDLLISIMPLVMDIINAILPVLIQLFQNLIPPIAQIISAVLPVLLELIHALLPVFQILIDLLMPVIDLFMQMITPILQLISTALVPLVNAIMPIIRVITDSLMPVLKALMSGFSEVFSGIASCVSENIGRVTDIINNIVDFIKNVFTGNWEGAWENVKNIFKNIIEGLTSIFKMPINAIIDLINGFLRGLGKIKIPDFVPGIGGKGFNIPEIPRLRIGMEYVPADDYLAYLHKGEAVLTAQENALYRSAGGFDGMMRALSSSSGNGEVYVTVQNTGSELEFDYRKMGAATAAALQKAGLTVKIGEREFGRVVREVLR